MYVFIVCIPLLILQGASGRAIHGVVLNNTFTLGYSIPWERGWHIGGIIGSAIVLGIREVHRRQLLPGYEIEWIWRDSHCEPGRGLAIAVDMWASVEDLDGIIGDGCSVVCKQQGLLAAAWGIPVVSWACHSDELSDKSNYPTFSRSDGTMLSWAPAFDALAQFLGWNKVAILTTDESVYFFAAKATKEFMEQRGKQIILRTMTTTVKGDQTDHQSFSALQNIMVDLKQQVRIIYAFAYQYDLENILLIAKTEGMLEGYAYVTTEWHKSITALKFPYKSIHDELLFEGLLGVSTAKPSGPAYEDFLRSVITEFKNPLFDEMPPHIPLSYNITRINSYAGNVYIPFSSEYQLT